MTDPQIDKHMWRFFYRAVFVSYFPLAIVCGILATNIPWKYGWLIGLLGGIVLVHVITRYRVNAAFQHANKIGKIDKPPSE